jgi:hypothetical protein
MFTVGTHTRYSRYEVEVVRKQDQVGFGRRPVALSYLEAAKEQLIFIGQRSGIVDADAAGVDVVDSPEFIDEPANEVCAIEMRLASSVAPISLRFGTALFHPLWQKITSELVLAKQLDESDVVHLRVFANKEHKIDVSKVKNHATVVREPLPLLEGEIDALMPDATPCGPMNERDYPVFVTEQVLQQAHEIVWERNRERGVWLVGNLFRQHRPHEIFAVVHTVFEARGARHERFSIDFSTETFTHVQQQLALTRKRRGRSADMLIGFHHTHAFLPSVIDGMESCPACSLRPTCTLTSSFFSPRDQAFHAAMFGSAPYAVEFVLGLTPREEFDLKMFCFDGGRFRERGYYRLRGLPAGMLNQGETQR